ncbi:glycoside hydrolase [Lichtheimia hyalospora FSU 10163]|nr:glycoside hydrolase [Lichtheimia hyalospora FSU 10163]
MILLCVIILHLVISRPWINASSDASKVRMLKQPSLVQYWGQNSAGATNSGQQQPLASYCDDSTDALVIAFIDQFNIGGQPGLALPCGSSCQDIGNDIKTCQSKGHTILLSLGGASGAYGFQNDQQASQFAETLWNTFGGGGGGSQSGSGSNSTNSTSGSGGSTGGSRPFGDAVVDGFDLDIEGGGSTGYVKFIQELRRLYKTDSSRQYLITAAPQCPFPDANLNEQILQGVDAVFVQFYNNFCSIDKQFNFDTWDGWASKTGAKVLIGIPGSPKAAGSGYVTIDQLSPAISKASSSKSYGGIMVWDASQSYSNTQGASPNFAVALGKLVHGGGSSGSGNSTSSGGSSGNDTSSGSDNNSTNSASASSPLSSSFDSSSPISPSAWSPSSSSSSIADITSAATTTVAGASSVWEPSLSPSSSIVADGGGVTSTLSVWSPDSNPSVNTQVEATSLSFGA